MEARYLGWFAIVRLGLVQAALGAIVVLTTSTLNRIMVVELNLAAVVPGALVGLHYGVQIARPLWGHGSDKGGKRTPWVVGGIALLALGARHVIAVEHDERALPALETIAARYPGRLEVVCADAQTFDPKPYLGSAKAKIVANLPYNIGTSLLIGWLTSEPWPPWYDMMVLMFQREVAERIAARENDEAYGRLAVLANWRCETKILFDISPSAFVPQPKVTSSVVRLVPRPIPAPCDRRLLEQVAAAAFGQRRKMLRQSLKSLSADPARLAAAAGVDPTRRAETIPVSGFVAMARELADIRAEKTNLP